MDITINRQSFLEAFSTVASVVPAKSPKPILQNVKLVADDRGTTLMGADLEIGIRHEVPGVTANKPGAALLPKERMGLILRASPDATLDLVTDGDKLTVTGLHSEYTFATEDPDLFPEVPDVDATSFRVVAAADLKKMIRRTMFACDVESTRYALGGALLVADASRLSLVATDGRRLAMMDSPSESEGNPAGRPGAVIPLKALKLIERTIVDSDPPVHLAVRKGGDAILVHAAGATIYARLVEGRFPRYQDVFPSSCEARIPMEAGTFSRAVEQACITTSDESRGVDFAFGGGLLRLSSEAADVGKSRVELPIAYDGATIAITFDARYIAEALKLLDPAAPVAVELIDSKNAAAFKTEDRYVYVVMPLTRERA